MIDHYKNLVYKNKISWKAKLLRYLWFLTWFFLFKPTPRWTMFRWRCFLLSLFGARIGIGCRVAPSCFVWAPWNLELEEYCSIADDVDCYCVTKISLGRKSCISQRVFLCTASHDIDSLLRPLICKPIKISSHAWVAAQSIILPGVEIGQGTVVGAGSVVTKDMPEWTVCAGNPCLPKKSRAIIDAHLDPSISYKHSEKSN